MDRLTAKNKDGRYAIPDSSIEEAIQRLGLFEDAQEELFDSQKQIPKDLEALRAEGKEKTVRYKEMMVQKLSNNNTVMFLERHGISFQ